jgi:hypothetical protein
MVKKSIVLHPVMDEYVRRTWAMLIDQGYEANYSTALNFMLLAATMEGSKEDRFSEETIQALQTFLEDREVLNRLNLRESLANLREFWGMDR